MYRFVALFLENESDIAAATRTQILQQIHNAKSRQWTECFVTSNFSVWHHSSRNGPMRVRYFDDESGVILGSLFDKTSSHSQEQILNLQPDRKQLLTCEQKIAFLIEKKWGSYVSFFTSHQSAMLTVFRDPSGSFPCYTTSYNGMRLFFSDIQDIIDIGIRHFSANIKYLEANVLLPKLQKCFTGLNEVDEILPGQAFFYSNHTKRDKIFWDPQKFIYDTEIDNVVEAEKILYESVTGAISNLAAQYSGIIHNIGGLDSSIVLGCLSSMGYIDRVNCVNLFTRSFGGDERHYAREMCAYVNSPLQETLLDPSNVKLLDIFQWKAQVSPVGLLDFTAPAGNLYQTAHAFEADALFYGVGGDNVFFQMPYILSALDYVGQKSDLGSLFAIASDASRYGNRSIAFVMKAMVKEKFAREDCFSYVYNLWSPDRELPFISQDILSQGPQISALHPMLLPDHSMAKGKYFHLLSSAFMSIEYYDPWGGTDGLERVCPLLTQPVIEAALKIPTWLMVYGGVDRGLARWTFRQHLPELVVQRTSKSNPDKLYEDIFFTNLGTIRDVLLNGVLVESGILVESDLEAALSDKNPNLRSIIQAILEFLNWEIWLQKW